jgi:hypothetical protein
MFSAENEAHSRMIEPQDQATSITRASLWRHAYPWFEAAFRVNEYQGNPFAPSLWADVHTPSATRLRIPAFYDGDHTWKIRFTPFEPGNHTVDGLFLGDRREAARRIPTETLGSTHFPVADTPRTGFVRVSTKTVQRFVFDDQTPYYPFGMNWGWGTPAGYPERFRKLAAAGLNWSRVWMTHWDGLNLDWRLGQSPQPGTLDLDVARDWDSIIQGAEQAGVRIQLVLQHHGQYSTFVNPNWDANPWNVANGGFLDRPEDFFTDDHARLLTRRKYRYAIARWGYSTSIMAWELFNEVEFTDGYVGSELLHYWKRYKGTGEMNPADLAQVLRLLATRSRQEGGAPHTLEGLQAAIRDIEHGSVPRIDFGLGAPVVARWHDEMARHIRDLDPYGHLVTTSSIPLGNPIWTSMDYYQFHAYQPDMIDALSRLPADPATLDKPAFYGEIGDHRVHDPAKTDGRYMRTMLWASLMSGAAGTAQMWAWDRVETLDFYTRFRGARRFLDAAGYADRIFLPSTRIQVRPTESDRPASLSVLAVRDRNTWALWIHDIDNVHWSDPPEIPGAALHGFPPGAYRVSWWDPKQGDILAEDRYRADADPGSPLVTPPFKGELAAILHPNEE